MNYPQQYSYPISGGYGSSVGVTTAFVAETRDQFIRRFVMEHYSEFPDHELVKEAKDIWDASITK